MREIETDLVIIGAGPGGYVAALRAAQLGLRTVCVEREPALGGTCLRIGCIPSKALLESSERYHEARHTLSEHGIETGEVRLDLARMLDRKDRLVAELADGVAGLFKQRGIERLAGAGRLDGPGRVVVAGTDSAVVTAPHILLAAGSESVSLPGVQLDGDRIGDSTAALAWSAVPEHLVVIGAGYIGLELGSVWRRLGARVTVVEYLDRILPGTDHEIAREALKLFRRQGMAFQLGARVTGVSREGDSCTVQVADAEPLVGDRVLVAVGRRPHTANLGLETVGIELDDTGRIPVDEKFATTAAGVRAVGDLIRGPMLAHKASEEGVACVEGIAGRYGHVDYDLIPAVCYTSPEIAAVGRTEEELASADVPRRKGVFFFRANSRARARGDLDGRVKILAHGETDRILGVHAIGPGAGELIGEATAAMAFGASSEDLARTCHAHPTLSETLHEAALAVAGRALHA